MEKMKTANKYKPSGLLSLCYEWLSAAVSAVIIVAILFSGVLRIVTVSGGSMDHTLHNGDRLLLSNFCYEPDYGDVVVVLRENDTPLIKRVIGLAGDRIRIDPESGIVYRNDIGLSEPYVNGGFTNQDRWYTERVIPEGTIFVMGDNRMLSADSRRDGPYPLENVVGKVYYRIAPNPGFVTNGE